MTQMSDSTTVHSQPAQQTVEGTNPVEEGLPNVPERIDTEIIRRHAEQDIPPPLSSTDGNAAPSTMPEQTDTNAPPNHVERLGDVPPQYSPAHGATPTSDKPVLEAHVEEEWQATLQQLKVNLAALREAERASAISPFLMPSVFVQSLFQSKAKAEASRRAAEDASSNTQDRQERIRMLEGLIIAGMLKLARIHPDPDVKAEWNGRAAALKETFDNPNATEADKESVLEGIGKGVGILLTTPFMLAGGAIYTAGAVLNGVGKTLSGLGQFITTNFK